MILFYNMQGPKTIDINTENIHKPIYNKLNQFYVSNKIPHIIFHGVSGSGKRTIVNDFLNIIYENNK